MQPDNGPTLFSQARFIDAIVRAVGDSCRPIELQSHKSQSAIFGVETVLPFGRRAIALAPFGLYAHPSDCNHLYETVQSVVAQLKTLSTTAFEWNVRYDHGPLAHGLIQLGIPFSRSITHALTLENDYETSFAKFNSTTRNLVRHAKREGVVVRRTQRPNDIAAYYQIHTKLASSKGNYGSVYPLAIFDELVKLSEDVVLLVAEVDNSIAGGALFFRDGDTLLYWHAAVDRQYSRQAPSYAILDFAVRMAHDESRRGLNLGGSNGIVSLEQFKAKWGAQPQYCWRFTWRNPLWRLVAKIRSIWRQCAG
jgi:hypothetical protein